MNHSNEYQVNMVSTLPDGNCGIGTYTGHMISELKNQNVIVKLVPLKQNCNSSIHYFKTALESARDCNIVHVQFEYHLFGDKFKLTGFYSLLFYPLLKILACVRGFKIVTTMHEIYQPSGIKDIIADLTKKPYKRTFYAVYALFRHFIIVKASDRIIVLSEFNKDKLIQTGVNPEKILVISHGTDIPEFLNRNKCKLDLGIDPAKKVITIFGMISHHKGHDILFKAAQEFESNIVFLIAGEAKSDKDREYLEDIETMAPAGTKFIGFVSQKDIPVLFNATDIMVLPYREISVSGVLELSMSYRIPTITSDLPYFDRIKEQFNCVLLFEKNNTNSLKKVITKLLEDEQLQMNLKQNAGKFADENNVAKATELTLVTYNELLLR